MTIDIVANYIRHLRNEAVRRGIRVPSVLYTLSGRGPVTEQQELTTAYHRLLTHAGHTPPSMPHTRGDAPAARRPAPPVVLMRPPAPRQAPVRTTQPTPLKSAPGVQEQSAIRIGGLLKQTGLGQIVATTRARPKDMPARTFTLLKSTSLGVRALQLRRKE